MMEKARVFWLGGLSSMTSSPSGASMAGALRICSIVGSSVAIFAAVLQLMTLLGVLVVKVSTASVRLFNYYSSQLLSLIRER